MSQYFCSNDIIGLHLVQRCNLKKESTDPNSPYSIPFDQTLWKIGISCVGITPAGEYQHQNFENLTSDSNSSYSITSGLTLFQLPLLNYCLA